MRQDEQTYGGTYAHRSSSPFSRHAIASVGSVRQLPLSMKPPVSSPSRYSTSVTRNVVGPSIFSFISFIMNPVTDSSEPGALFPRELFSLASPAWRCVFSASSMSLSKSWVFRRSSETAGSPETAAWRAALRLSSAFFSASSCKLAGLDAAGCCKSACGNRHK
jgi:hypothetical protein